VHDDVVADAHVGHALADRVHDPGRVRAHDMEVRRLAPARLRLRHVHGHTTRRPHVVEVHTRRHDHHERLTRADLGNLDHLVADRVLRVAIAFGAHELRVHRGRHLAERRELADVVDVLGHAGLRS
jgi:hypothetical protein